MPLCVPSWEALCWRFGGGPWGMGSWLLRGSWEPSFEGLALHNYSNTWGLDLTLCQESSLYQR